MAKIIWAKSARNDLKAIFDYIARDSSYYAGRFIDRLTGRVFILTDNIKAGKIVPEFGNDSLRELIEGDYRIIYYIRTDDNIKVIRIHHSAKILKRL